MLLDKAAERDLMRLSNEDQARIRKALDQLSTGTGDVKKLKGASDEFRIRAGGLRARFTRDTTTRTITVPDIFHRDKGY